MTKIFFSIIIIACLFSTQAFASGAARIVEKGNRLYKDQKYEDALKLYDQALASQPDSAVINFNIGAAQYKTHDYQKANGFFEKSLNTEDKSVEAKANYNLGNSRYMLGLSKENNDLSGAVQLLEGALANYKRTLELVPRKEDAQVNYKIVEKKLKELKEKLKQQPQENKNSQKQQEQNKEEQFNQEQAQQQKQGESKKQEQQAAAQSPSQSEEPGRVSAQPEESKEMSTKEADMLLKGYRQEENAAGMLKDDRKGVKEKVLKDW